MRELPAAAGDHLKDALRIEPGLGAEHDRLGRCGVVHRDQQIGDELHAAAVAEGAEIMRHSREPVEDRTAAAERAASSPLANTARSFTAACAPVPDSGQSSSIIPAAASRSRAAYFASIGKVLTTTNTSPGCGCATKVPATVASSARDARQRNQRDLRAADAAPAAAIGRAHPVLRQRPHLRRVDIVAAHRKPGGGEVARDRATHDAEPDHRDAARLGHIEFSSAGWVRRACTCRGRTSALAGRYTRTARTWPIKMMWSPP